MEHSKEYVEQLLEAVGLVLEGWTLPDTVRKILETAYWNKI